MLLAVKSLALAIIAQKGNNLKHTFKYLILAVICVAMANCKAKKLTEAIASEAGNAADEKFQKVYFEAQKERAIENYEKSYAKFEECISLNPNEDAIYYELAKLDTLNQNYSAALNHINESISLEPNNLWYEKFKVKTLLETGQLDAAEKSYESIIKRDPFDVVTRMEYLDFSLAREDYPNALNLLNQIQNIQGKKFETSAQKYDVLMKQGKSDDALAELQELAELLPFDLQNQLKIAAHYKAENNQTKAIETLMKIAELDPSNGEAQLAMADFYVSSGDSKAISFLESGIADASAPVVQKCDVLKAAFEKKLISASDALAFSNELKNLHPDSPEVWETAILVSKNSPDVALENFTRFLELSPGDVNSWIKILTLASDVDLIKAEELASDALELYPLQPDVYLKHGEILIASLKYTQAIATLKNGLDITIDSDKKTEFHFLLTQAAFKSQDYEMAQNWLQKSVNKLKTGPQLELAGDVSFKNGDATTAVNYWKQAKTAGGGSEVLEEKIANEIYIEK